MLLQLHHDRSVTVPSPQLTKPGDWWHATIFCIMLQLISSKLPLNKYDWQVVWKGTGIEVLHSVTQRASINSCTFSKFEQHSKWPLTPSASTPGVVCASSRARWWSHGSHIVSVFWFHAVSSWTVPMTVHVTRFPGREDEFGDSFEEPGTWAFP